MKNQINIVKPYEIKEEELDSLLPFEGKKVWLWNVSKTETGYGHWKIAVELEIDGEKIELTHTTTNSRLIDAWKDDAGEVNQSTITTVIDMTLSANDNKMVEFVESIEATK